jgi:hypothetical protein
MRTFAFCLANLFLIGMAGPAVANDADANSQDKASDKQFMILTEPANETPGWPMIYSAYSYICHHSYESANRSLMFALEQGAGTLMLKASTDLSYLSRGLSNIAAKHHESSVSDSSCDVQILQAFILKIVDSESSAIDTLKTVAINNPTYPSLQFLKTKIRALEFEKSMNPWNIPLDVSQSGGNANHFTKWRASKFPLKVFIPPDSAASKISGYKFGDGQLLRSAFEAWQSQSRGKIRFVYEPLQARADITCAWVSDQKEFPRTDALGICCRWSDAEDNLRSAKIKILTFKSSDLPPNSKDSFRSMRSRNRAQSRAESFWRE